MYWQMSCNLRANSGLKSNQYSTPILGLIILRFADNIYRRSEAAINAEFQKRKGTRRKEPIDKIAKAKCRFYLPSEARYDFLLELPEQEDSGGMFVQSVKFVQQHREAVNNKSARSFFVAVMASAFVQATHDAEAIAGQRQDEERTAFYVGLRALGPIRKNCTSVSSNFPS